jgi:hypothetical protein
MATEPASAWERRPHESAKAYAGFVYYRDLGDQRGITAVAQALHKSRGLIGRWSARWRWVERVAEFDQHVDHLRLIENERARRSALARQSRIASRILDKCEAGLTTLDGHSLKPLELSRLFATAANVERHALGIGTNYDPPVPAARVEFVVVQPELCTKCGGASLYTGENSCPECSGTGSRTAQSAGSVGLRLNSSRNSIGSLAPDIFFVFTWNG